MERHLQHCPALQIRLPYLGPQFMFCATTANAKQEMARMEQRMVSEWVIIFVVFDRNIQQLIERVN
jgi:hypothetical protein